MYFQQQARTFIYRGFQAKIQHAHVQLANHPQICHEVKSCFAAQ